VTQRNPSLTLVAAIGLASLACTSEAPQSDTAASLDPPMAVGSTKAASDPLADVQNYRLTSEDLRKYVESRKNLDQVGRDHAELEPATHINVNEFDTLEARIDANQHLRKAIADAGLTTRQFLVLSWVVLNTSFASLASDQDAAAMLSQARVHPDNLTFFRQHKSELDALSRRK
jgi:hypothetical protein